MKIDLKESFTKNLIYKKNGNSTVFAEKNIIGLGFFSFSDNRATNNSAKIISGKPDPDGTIKRITIAPNSLYGKPTTADLEKYLAFQRILLKIKNRNGGVIANPITFTPSELLHELGHSNSGSNFRDVDRWLDVMSSTQIKSENMLYSKRKQKFVSDSFVVFQRVKRIREIVDGKPAADKIAVWLSDCYLENIEENYVLNVFDIYKFLEKTIAKLLFPHLHIWLFASRRRGVFEKRYTDFCRLLGIRRYKYLSQIEHKLGPALDELVAIGCLSKWSIDKTINQTDFKIMLRPGFRFGQNYPETNGFYKKPQNKRQLVNSVGTGAKISKLNNQQKVLVRVLTDDFRISAEKSLRLVAHYPQEIIHKQLTNLTLAIPGLIRNEAGFLIRAIENDYSFSEIEIEDEKPDDSQQNHLAEKKLLIIDRCNLCDDFGQRNIISEKDSTFGISHNCSHDPDFEKLYVDHI